MHLTKLASTIALVAAVSASKSCAPDEVNCNGSPPAKEGWGTARIHNRCEYTVYMWSIITAMGCNPDKAIVLKPGETYTEGFRAPVGGQGASIKISKTKQCKGVDINQLEYFIDETPHYGSNYLDVSYVDCQGKNCPACQDGFYLKAGNLGDGTFAANDANEICPILSCRNAEECATMAYVLPDDRQTKSCNQAADIDFYMCGHQSPDEYTPAPAPSSSEAEPEPTKVNEGNTNALSEPEEVAASAITAAPKPKEKEYHVKTEVVVVTATEIAYVNAKKRHAHGHRHQHFRA